MKDSPLFTLYRYELRMLLRDRRTLLVSILLPIVVMPIFLVGPRWVEKKRQDRRQEKTFEYAVVGSEAELARELIAAFEPPPTDPDDESPAPLDLRETSVEDPAAALDARELPFYVEALSAEEAAARAAEERRPAGETVEVEAGPPGKPGSDEDDEERLALPVLRLVSRDDWDDSEIAARTMEHRLRRVLAAKRWELLADRGLDLDADQVAPVDKRDVATADEVSGAALGRFATLVFLLLILTGGSVVAADSIAGEKERGTLETLLTSAANRTEIVVAKLGVIVTVGLGIALVQILNLLVYLKLDVLPLPESFAISIGPGRALVLLLLLVPLVLLVGGALLMVSGRCKTYKEFQVYFLPVFLLILAPALASILPGLKLRSAIVAVPIANIAVAVREVLTGDVDLLMLPVAWLVSAAAAVLTLRATLRSLSTERLITAAEIDRQEHFGGPALFPRRVVRWFALMWALIFAVSLNFPELGMKGQIAVNLVLIFLGGSLLMIRVYRLDPRQALALRPVKPGVWPAVILGAPSSILAAVAVGKLSALLFPVPERWLESFGKALMPPEMPLWQLLLLVAVLPGVCEELAFRGVLLHGLRRRFHPAVLCLVVAGVFALFHFELIRILPVATLGVAVSALTLLTGSIFPAMLWHALHNATAIISGRFDIELSNLPPAAYVASCVILVLVFAWLWRQRTPYPDLRSPAAR